MDHKIISATGPEDLVLVSAPDVGVAVAVFDVSIRREGAASNEEDDNNNVDEERRNCAAAKVFRALAGCEMQYEAEGEEAACGRKCRVGLKSAPLVARICQRARQKW